jgi:DNA-binding transcriptional LysR family regulator
MDRIDAMKVFVAALDEGSLAGAGRKLGRSPAAVSRAVAFLEGHVGVPLLHRTTRSSRLSEVGEHYAAACRRLLTEFNEAETMVARGRSAPGGTLTLTGPTLGGEEVLRSILDDFLDAFTNVTARLILLDRPVNLIDEGVDVALSIGQLPDSSMVAIRVGQVRRIIVAAPSYLARRPRIDAPGDLAKQQIVACSQADQHAWSFPHTDGSTGPRTVQVTPRLFVNSDRAAIASALEGRGVARLFSYQVAEYVRDGRLQIVLRPHEYTPLPVHIVTPEGRLSVPKLRAFVDFAVPRLRSKFACLAVDAPGEPSNTSGEIRQVQSSHHGSDQTSFHHDSDGGGTPCATPIEAASECPIEVPPLVAHRCNLSSVIGRSRARLSVAR